MNGHTEMPDLPGAVDGTRLRLWSNKTHSYDGNEITVPTDNIRKIEVL